MYISNPTASFTRPADTSVYAIGDLVANSTTGTSVVPMQFSLGNSFGVGSYRMTRCRLVKSGVVVTNATFRVHLYQVAAPTFVAGAGDNAAWNGTGAANWLGNMDVASMLAFTDGAAGTGSAPAGSEMFIKTNSGSTIWAVLAALGTYTPASGEIFTLTLEEVDAF